MLGKIRSHIIVVLADAMSAFYTGSGQDLILTQISWLIQGISQKYSHF